MKKPIIGIVGYGYLGKAFEAAFSPKCKVKINDLNYEVDGIKFFNKGDLYDCDLIFVGVPTPYSKSNGFDYSNLNDVLDKLNKTALIKNKQLLVCIKSAFPPSYCENFRKSYNSLSITVSPEYLSGKDNIRDMLNHKVLIVGSDKKDDADIIFDLFINHSVANKEVKTDYCTPEEACLIKYMENSFLALKCVFMSEFYKIHQKLKQPNNFNHILKLWMLDQRMGNYPYQIPYKADGLKEYDPLGYCSHCLCKDERAIRDEAKKLGVNTAILDAMHEVNNNLRQGIHNRCECITGGVIK